MAESQPQVGHDEALLDRLFGTVEDLEAENRRRQTIYPQFRHEHVEAPAERPRLSETVRSKIASRMVELFSHDNERYESD